MGDLTCQVCGQWHRVMRFAYRTFDDTLPKVVCKPCLDYAQHARSYPTDQDMIASLISLHFERIGAPRDESE